MPSPPPAHQRRHPRPSRDQRIARRAARQTQTRNSSRLSADNSAFLELASLQFEALARQSASRQPPRSLSPPPRRRFSRSRSPVPPYSSYRSRTPVTERHYTPERRPFPAESSFTASTQQNPFTVTGRDPSPHQEVGATARPSPEAESVIGWADYDRERQNNPRRTDSYRPVYDQQPSQRGNQASRVTRGTRGSRGPRISRGTRGTPRSLFERITPRQ
jgi:hypothetical protein